MLSRCSSLFPELRFAPKLGACGRTNIIRLSLVKSNAQALLKRSSGPVRFPFNQQPLARPFSSKASWHQPISDPTRPDVFYHYFEPPNPYSDASPVFAVSFTDVRPSTASSASVAGWLPASEDAGLNDFKENPKFRALLHRAIKEGLEMDVDEIHRNGAIQLGSGWMHIHDERNIPDLNRIGDPDDIIATVLVDDSKILPETYQPMPAYRICTTDGLTKLTPGLMARLKILIRSSKEEK